MTIDTSPETPPVGGGVETSPAPTSTQQPARLRVAVTQFEPAWLNLQASVDKTCSLIAEAAEQGACILAFPECWITGYPGWIW